MSGNMNRIPQAQLDELRVLANKAIETRMERVESKSAPKHIVVPKMIAHGKAMMALKRKTTPEDVLALISEIEDLTKTLTGFGEEG